MNYYIIVGIAVAVLIVVPLLSRFLMRSTINQHKEEVEAYKNDNASVIYFDKLGVNIPFIYGKTVNVKLVDGKEPYVFGAYGKIEGIYLKEGKHLLQAEIHTSRTGIFYRNVIKTETFMLDTMVEANKNYLLTKDVETKQLKLVQK